ncbi:MAG: hypothetical protein FWD05_06605 [Oscillospiraceae bacterium]|nr:hypothetical protein [Oscillospiraceae bacterium]
MKKIVLLLLTVSFILVAVVGCAGPDVTVGGAGAGGAEEPDAVYEPEEEVIDVYEPDVGSEETFDDVHIVLPGEGEEGQYNEVRAEYLFITGEITFINNEGDATSLTIETPEGATAILNLDVETVFPFSDEFDVGDTVTGWYLSMAPMMAIYPPQYNIAVLSAGMPEGSNIKVDRFEAWESHEGDYFISQDGMFAFTTDENTEITLADGQEFTINECAGRRIVVVYGMSTRSIPEIATANRLIVLFESIVPLG